MSQDLCFRAKRRCFESESEELKLQERQPQECRHELQPEEYRTKYQQLKAVLTQFLCISWLSQLCMDYLELPPNQLWMFADEQLICFDAKTSKLQHYPCKEPIYEQVRPVLASSWRWNEEWSTDFILWSSCGRFRFGTLLDGKLKVDKILKVEFSTARSFIFSFTFQNQFYTIGKQSYVWKNPEEKKEIPITNSEFGVAWIVHDKYLYKFGRCTGSRYSLHSFAQTSLPRSLSARGYCSVALHPESKCIFLSGGFVERKGINVIEIFDTKTQQFQESKGLLPQSLWLHYSFCFNNFLFLVGGRCETENGWVDNKKIWKHALTSEGTFLGQWVLTASLSHELFEKACLFG